VKERFVYNDRNYLEEHYHQVNSHAEELLAKYTYNELGQVTNKQVGNNLQSIDYKYNVRGWLTDINDANNIGSKLFAYKINYAQRDGLETPNLDFPNYKVQPRYNGNITETSWRAVDVGGQTLYSTPERQGFVYDKANRITAGFYQLPDNPAAKANSEIIENYDKNGNIINLKRTGSRIKGQVKMMDNLTYNITGNRLSSVTDASLNMGGYEGGGGAISYDDNGNMTAMADKGITGIRYNFLNLPEVIEQTNISTFYYRADGVKLRKKFVLNNEAGSNTMDTEYLDGFVYTTTRTAVLREALAVQDPVTVAVAHARQEEIFTEPESVVVGPGDPPLDASVSLAYFPTAEGYYDYRNNQYIYQYKDHLGNVRSSYTRNPDTGSAEVLDRNDYYPFGMNMQGYSSAFDSAGGIYNNKYNQKELQETGFYDYGWRQYMPDLGRWFGMDKLSEKFHSASPYAYVMNNPISFFDPDGRDMQMPGWLQNLWNATNNNQVTTFGGFDSSGNPSSISFGGSFSSAQFTSFYNFLSSGQTGTFTYTTFASGGDVGSYNSTGMDIDMSGVDFHNVTIKGHQDGNAFGEDLSKQFSVFGFGNDVKTQLIEYGVRKSAGLTLKEFNALNTTAQEARILGSLGSFGSNYLKFFKGAGIAGSVVTTGYSSYKVYDQFQKGGIGEVANHRDVVDTAVGVVGLGTTALVAVGLVSNPVGWAIGAGVLIYGASTLIYDTYNEQ